MDVFKFFDETIEYKILRSNGSKFLTKIFRVLDLTYIKICLKTKNTKNEDLRILRFKQILPNLQTKQQSK